MSTRANVIIWDREFEEAVMFYRHSDGYPAGALPTLRTFLQWVQNGYIRNNGEQAAGWLVILGHREQQEMFQRSPQSAWNSAMGWKVGSYEPATSIHGDIEWLYVVDLREQLIFYRNVGDSFWTADDGKKVAATFIEGADLDKLMRTLGAKE